MEPIARRHSSFGAIMAAAFIQSDYDCGGIDEAIMSGMVTRSRPSLHLDAIGEQLCPKSTAGTSMPRSEGGAIAYANAVAAPGCGIAGDERSSPKAGRQF